MSSTEERRIDDVASQSSPSGMRVDEVVLLFVFEACKRPDVAQPGDCDTVGENSSDGCRPDITKIPLNAVVLVVGVVK